MYSAGVRMVTLTRGSVISNNYTAALRLCIHPYSIYYIYIRLYYLTSHSIISAPMYSAGVRMVTLTKGSVNSLSEEVARRLSSASGELIRTLNKPEEMGLVVKHEG